MDQERKKELLKKFADRDLSPSEQQEFWAMVDSGGHYGLLDEELDLETADHIEVPFDMEQSLASVKDRVTAQIRPPAKKSFKLFYQLAAGIAAVLVVVVGVKAYLYHRYIQDTQTFLTVNVPVGATQKIVLADSSVVTAFSGAVFRYPKAFAETERRVYLTTGKALFEVVKNRAKPFSVEAGELQTTVLGTSFTVQYNPAYRWSKVNLYTGKVMIHPLSKNNGPTIYLSPGKAYEYVAGKGKLSNFDLQKTNANDGLLFERTPFSEAIYRIASYYKINIAFDPQATKNFTVNGDFSAQRLDETLKALSFIHQIQFIKTDSINYKLMKK